MVCNTEFIGVGSSMISARLTINVLGNTSSARPTQVDAPVHSKIDGWVEYPFSVTGVQPTLTCISQPATGISYYPSSYEVAYPVVHTDIYDNRVWFDLDIRGITGVSHGSLYGLKLTGTSTTGNRATADIVIGIQDEVE